MKDLKKNINETKLKIVKLTYLYYFVVLMMAIILGFIAPIIIQIITGEAFKESSVYVIWIALGYSFNGMYLMVVNYIFYNGKTHILAFITFATTLLNILLNYLFIKKAGAIGAAQSTTITFLIKFILVWYLSSKVHNMPWNIIKK
ncbi:hypothetical protein [Tissierella sp.]|uniref:hypothetical protein n=1 Tax=Tissierella sp. TaxID=41274 RepID=UPI003F98CDA6